MMKVVWRHTLNISKWVQTSFNGEKEAHILIIESLKIAQNIINDKKVSILKKWTENKERELKAKLDKEEQERKAKEEEEKAKSQELVQPELKKKTTSSINQKVSVSKDTNRAKKANRKKLINQITVPKTKKKGKDEKNEKNEKELEEVKKEIVEEDKKEQKEDKPPEISDKELNSLNLQIYNDVYAYFISKLKEEQLLKSL